MHASIVAEGPQAIAKAVRAGSWTERLLRTADAARSKSIEVGGRRNRIDGRSTPRACWDRLPRYYLFHQKSWPIDAGLPSEMAFELSLESTPARGVSISRKPALAARPVADVPRRPRFSPKGFALSSTACHRVPRKNARTHPSCHYWKIRRLISQCQISMLYAPVARPCS